MSCRIEAKFNQHMNEPCISVKCVDHLGSSVVPAATNEYYHGKVKLSAGGV